MGISYNDNVKAPGTKEEYTPEDIKEFALCMNDFKYFMKKYVVITTSKGKALFEPYPFQEEMLDIFSNHRFACILSSRQSGKCVFSQSLLTLRDKNTKEVEEISIGNLYDKYK